MAEMKNFRVDSGVSNSACFDTSRWLPAHVGGIASTPENVIPRIAPHDTAPILPGTDLWDLWPLQYADGGTVEFDGWSVWFVLSAPSLPDPEDRHAIARIRLMTRRTSGGIDGTPALEWRDGGHALPDGFCPGRRKWAGSALFDPARATVTLFWTPSGFRGRDDAFFAQRLFHARARLDLRDGHATLSDWSVPTETLVADGATYLRTAEIDHPMGLIKGFRDPAHFRDPADGARYLLFTASLGTSASLWSGCVGMARARDATLDQWALLPPPVAADDLNNELERPHIVYHDGQYYLFWSTQRRVFAPEGPAGPNGLYAMVAPSIYGPWQPVNGSGLVAANPGDAPFQAYSWWVSHDLTVAGFADYPGVAPDGMRDDPAWRRAHFAATPAPLFRIVLTGDRAWVDHDWTPPAAIPIKPGDR